jgi:hypothetical protein
MSKLYTLLLVVGFLLVKPSYAVVYTWNGSISTAWGTMANWTPNTGVPGAGDDVVIVSVARIPVYNNSSGVTNFTLTSGTIDLGTFNLNVSGNATLTAGTLTNGTLLVNGGAGNTAMLTNPITTASGILNITTGAITLNGGTYAGAVTLNQTGATQTTGMGLATFNGTVSITNSGTSNLRANSGTTFNGTTTLNNTGTGTLQLELTGGNTYNATVNINNSSTSNLRMCYAGTTNFSGNIVLSNTNTGNIYFCELGTAVCNLNAGYSLSIGAGGFTNGNLFLQRFNQLGATAQTLTLTASSVLQLINSCTFNGTLNFSAPDFALSNCTYNGATTLTKTGPNNNPTNGGNTFNSTLTVNHNGTTGYWSFGNGTADIYNGDVYSNNNSSDRLIFGHNSTNNQFNGNFIATQIGSSVGTALTWNAGTSCTMAAGKTIQIGGAGFNTGWFYIQRLTQLGAAALTLTTTGTSTLYLGPSTNFSGAVTATAPGIYTNGATYPAAVVLNKTGASNDNGSGANSFATTLTVNNSGSGYILFAQTTADTYTGAVTVNNSGTGYVHMAYSSGGNTFGSTLTVNNTGTGAATTGFLLCNAAGSSATVNGAVTMTNNGTSTGTNDIHISENGTTTFNSTVSITNNGGGAYCRVFMCEGATPGAMTCNQDVTFLNTSTATNDSYFRILRGACTFNGNINLANTATATSTNGIFLAWGGGNPGTATLANTKSVLVTGLGFSTGKLCLAGFTQLGATAQNITLTGTATLQLGSGSTFNANFTSSSPSLLFNGGTFAGTVNSTKTGTTNDNGAGGNTFNGVCTITSAGSGYLLFGNGTPDTWNTNVTFNNTGTNHFYVAYNSLGNVFNGTTTFTNQSSAAAWMYVSSYQSTTFNGNIVVNSIASSSGVIFGSNGGTTTLANTYTITAGATGFTTGTLQLKSFSQTGGTAQNITLTGTATIQYGPLASFGANLTSSSPGVLFNGGTYTGTVNATKTGATNDVGSGGNTFQAISTFTNNGSGYYMLGNTNPDTWNADVTFTSTGSERVLPCWNSAGNMFNGNIIFNSTGSSIGIAFCGGVAATATQVAGKSLQIGGSGYTSGYLTLQRFTQLGNTAINLTLAASANYLQFGPASSFGGNIVSSSPGLLFNGGTFAGIVNSTKTGASNDAGSGGNTFNGITTFTANGSGYLMFGNGAADTWNTDVTFNNAGTANMYVSNNSTGNVFNGTTTFTNQSTAASWIYVSPNLSATFTGNIVVNSIASSTGISFGSNSGSAVTLANTFTITAGATGFNAGTLQLKNFTQVGATAQTITLTGAATLLFSTGSAFAANVNCTSPGILFNGTTFSGTLNATKNGSSSDFGNGGNTFQGSSTFTNSGTGFLLFGNSAATPDIWNGDVTFTNTGSDRILPCWQAAGNQFNGNITFNSTGSSVGINFCGGAGATATQAAGKSIQIGGLGYSAGYLILQRFTQLGNSPINLTLSATANYLQFGPSSSFIGNVVSVSPGINFNGSTFAGTVNSTKTGASNDGGTGNNTFNGVCTFTNSGTGYLLFGNGNPDTWNANVSYILTGPGTMYVAYNSTGNVFNGTTTFTNQSTAASNIYVANYQSTTFNGNILVNSTGGSSSGVSFGGNGGTTTLASGFTLAVGATGFTIGNLALRNFTQLGATAQALTLTGTSGLQIGAASTFNGTLVATAPDIYPYGCTYNSAVTFTKTAGGSNSNNGNLNTFNSTIAINNQSSGGYFMLGNNASDVFNDNITVSSTGTGGVRLGNNGGTGFPTLAATKTILIGGAGFANGSLYISQFTQLGSATINLTLTGSAVMYLGPTTIFGGPVNAVGPDIWAQGATYNGAVSFTKNGGSSNHNNQFLNTFNSTTTINQQSNGGYFMLGYNSADAFNDNIILNCTGTGGIYLGWTSGTGTPTLAATKTISVGGAGYSAGFLSLNTFTQLGTAAMNLSFTGANTSLTFARSTVIGGNLITSTPDVYFNGATFNGTVNATKTGASGDNSAGGNTFNGASIFNNTGTGQLLLANGTADAYNSDVTFVKTNTGLIYPNYAAACTYAGNISTVGSNAIITFGNAAGGSMIISGGSGQTFSAPAAFVPTVTRMTMATTANTALTLNTRINISVSLTMTTGNINTTTSNILNMNNVATTTIGSTASYINGPMNYDMAFTGARTLNFPIGKVNDWRPAILNLTHSAATAYTYNAEVFNAAASLLAYSLPATIDTVSGVHYWDINRYTTGTVTSVPSTGLSGNQIITLYFDLNDDVRDGPNLSVCKNTSAAPTAWIDIGGTGAPAYAAGVQLTGSVTSTSSPSLFNSFSRFTLGSQLVGNNPLPIQLLSFDAVLSPEKKVLLNWETATEVNNDYFTIERSGNGTTFEEIGRVKGAGNSSSLLYYSSVDANPLANLSYYRLKQTDYNGHFVYSKIDPIRLDALSAFHVFPNPANSGESIQLLFNTSQAKEVLVVVRDVNGKEVYSKVVITEKGNGQVMALDPNNKLASGVYLITATSDNEIFNQKLVIQ